MFYLKKLDVRDLVSQGIEKLCKLMTTQPMTQRDLGRYLILNKTGSRRCKSLEFAGIAAIHESKLLQVRLLQQIVSGR